MLLLWFASSFHEIAHRLKPVIVEPFASIKWPPSGYRQVAVSWRLATHLRFVLNQVMNWAIPENIHTQPRTASMSYPPLAFGNSKMCYPPMPSEFHNREPPLPFRISVFLEVHFRLSNAYMNKRT